MAKPATRATRSAAKNAPKSRAAEKAAPKDRKTNTKAKGRAELEHDSASEDEEEDEQDVEEEAGIESDEYEDGNGDDDEDAAGSINSDNLDDDSDVDDAPSSRSRKRKRDAAASSTSNPKSTAKGSPTSTVNGKGTAKGKGKGKTSPNSTASAGAKKSSPRKKRKTARDEDEDEDEVDLDLEDGQEIVGRVVQAPTTGRVPAGQISQNTFNFLAQLKKPECNDREWFKLHEPIYRLAEKEWKDFVDAFTDVLVGADPQIPHLPPKDVIHRIYRDVRFSNDKTPYKTGFSASFSRSGRKGIFAAYHVAIRPGDSILAAGSWCPGKNELQTIRNNLLRSSARLRGIISSPTFVGLFGEPSPDPKGGRRNIFGREDELKVAPKGVPKDHKDIDLLKCRSFAVVYQFTDKQVLQPDFKDELGRLVEILRPFVHCLNDLMTIQDADDSDDDGSNEDEDEDENNAEDASASHTDDEE